LFHFSWVHVHVHEPSAPNKKICSNQNSSAPNKRKYQTA
jgi:hypothetical protein